MTGTVIDDVTSAPIKDVWVYFEPAMASPVSAYTDADGEYTVELPEGSYTVSVRKANYVLEYNGDRRCPASPCTDFGPPVVVTVGSSQVIDFGLEPYATITGTFTDEVTSAPLVSTLADAFSVRAYDADGTAVRTSSPTDGSGQYTLSLPAGTAYLRTFAPSQYVNEVYNNVACAAVDCRPSLGTPLTATAGGVLVIDFALSKGGSIAGTVGRSDSGTAVTGAVLAYNAQTSFVKSGQVTIAGASSIYHIDGLLPGNYYLRTAIAAPPGQVIDELYPNIPCPLVDPCRIASGTVVAVTTGTTTTGVDFVLDPGGAISGTIANGETGAPVAAAVVAIAGGRIVRSIHTDAAGHYALTGLPAREYYVKTQPDQPPYLDTWFWDACAGCVAYPLPVLVTAGATSTGINIACHGGAADGGRGLRLHVS